MALKPVYRLTVFQPRSYGDHSETVPLTPAAGAPHSDAFVVTSMQGIAGAKPYLDLPSSRGGTIDAQNKKTTISTLTVKLLDARVTPGGGNAARWVTAFLGDGSGGNMLLGRLAKVEQSVNGGVTFAPYFTGRISGPTLQGKLWIQLALKDVADDLALDVFVGAPAAAVSSYAALAQIAPIGLLQPVRAAASGVSSGTGYAGLPLTTPLRAKTNAPNGAAFTFDVDHSVGDPYRTNVTQALLAASDKALARAYDNTAAGKATPRPVVMIAVAGSGVYHAYDLELVPLNVGNPKKGSTQYWKTSIEGVQARQQAVSGSQPPPAAGTSIDFYIVDSAAEPTASVPLLIDDVNPVTYAQHLCAGYFGRLDASGAPFRSVPFNANGVDGTKVPPYRTIVRKASKLNVELEALCQQYHWAYYVDAAGAVTLVDLHRSSLTSAAVTLTDADLESTTSTLGWQQDRESAVTSFFASYYPERRMSAGALPKPFDKVTSPGDLPDVPTVFIEELASVAALTAEIGPRSADMKPQTLQIDAKGFRYLTDGSSTSEHLPAGSNNPASLRADVIRGYLIAYSDEITGPFGLGPSYIDIVCRRGSANINDPVTGAPVATPGKYASLTFTALPDPLTNQRGGPRLGLIISRTDNGPRVKLRLLDAGANSVAVAPTLGMPTLASGVITLPVTLNAAGEPVRVQYAVTAQSVAVEPSADDPAWVPGPFIVASGNATIGNLPGSGRVWLRARSQSGAGAGFKLPSAWVSPASPYVDLLILAPPASLTVTGATVDDLLAAWVNGDSTLGVEIFLVDGAVLVPSDATLLASILPAGTTRHTLPALTGGATYTVGVRARDTSGGVSALVTATFVATTAVRTLDSPSDPNGFSGSQDPSYGLPRLDDLYGLAVAATEFPGFTEFQEAVETAQYSGEYGSPVTVAKVANVQGDWTLFDRVAPNDGLTRQLSARTVRDGADPSDYTAPVIVSPWSAKRLGQFATIVQAEELSDFAYTDSADNTQRTFTWSRGSLVEAVYVYLNTVTLPIATNPFIFSSKALIATLRAGTDSFTIAKPAYGKQSFVQFEPRMADITAGAVRRAVLDPPPSASLSATMRAVKSADGSTEDLYITPKSAVGEQVTVFYRDGDSSSSPLYQLCASGTDSTPRYVDSGTEVGASDWFVPLAGGAPVQVLSAIVVRDLQVKRVTIGLLGKISLAEAWLPWDMVMANVASGSATISFDPVPLNTASQAYWGAAVVLPANALSARWSANITLAASNAGVPNFPSDATVAGSGTLNTAGRTFQVTAQGPVNLGDMVSLVVIPFTGAGGTGTQLPAIRMFASFASFQTAKTIRIGASELKYSSGPAIALANGYVSPATTGLGVYVGQLVGVPKGVPINAFRARLYRETGVGTAELQVYKIDTNGVPSGPFGGVLLHTTSGWQTVAVSVTITAADNDGSVYNLLVALEQGSEPSNISVRCAYVEADYTQINVATPGAA